jgi:hypothetical protein
MTVCILLGARSPVRDQYRRHSPDTLSDHASLLFVLLCFHVCSLVRRFLCMFFLSLSVYFLTFVRFFMIDSQFVCLDVSVAVFMQHR